MFVHGAIQVGVNVLESMSGAPHRSAWTCSLVFVFDFLRGRDVLVENPLI